MFPGNPVMRAAQFLVIFQIRKTARLRPETDVPGKNAGEEQRVIADVRAQQETGAVIGLLQRRHHFKEIIERIGLAGQHAFGARGFGKRGQDFRDVIRDGAVAEVGAFEDMPHEHVEIEPAGNAETTAAFEQRVEEVFVVEDQIAGIFIGEQLDETGGISPFGAENFEDEFDVLRGELHPAVGLNHLHHLLCPNIRFTGPLTQTRTLARLVPAALPASIISSNLGTAPCRKRLTKRPAPRRLALIAGRNTNATGAGTGVCPGKNTRALAPAGDGLEPRAGQPGH